MVSVDLFNNDSERGDSTRMLVMGRFEGHDDISYHSLQCFATKATKTPQEFDKIKLNKMFNLLWFRLRLTTESKVVKMMIVLACLEEPRRRRREGWRGLETGRTWTWRPSSSRQIGQRTSKTSGQSAFRLKKSLKCLCFYFSRNKIEPFRELKPVQNKNVRN